MDLSRLMFSTSTEYFGGWTIVRSSDIPFRKRSRRGLGQSAPSGLRPGKRESSSALLGSLAAGRTRLFFALRRGEPRWSVRENTSSEQALWWEERASRH